MQRLLAYIENKTFVRWVYSPDETTNLYWENFQKSNPDEVAAIREARLILLHLKSPKSTGGIQSEKLYSKIIAEAQKRKRVKTSLRFVRISLQYAAVAALFLAIGVYTMELRYRNSINEMGRQFANVSVFNGQNARLILTDGKTVDITEKLSAIRYGANGTLIVDDKDTISQNFKSEANPINQMIVPYGKKSSITLPDGTIAYLNAGSRLIFPPVFTGSTREVFLAGEGYFVVAHNPQKPFFVKTTNLDVQAVGTQFNVSAYPSDRKIEVVLAEGKVNISQNNLSIFKESRQMQPNDMVCYNKENSSIRYKQVKTENYTSWHLGYINAESTELHKLVSQLERYYDVTIRFGATETGHKKITGKLQLKPDVDEMLRVIASTTTLKIEKKSEHEYILN